MNGKSFNELNGPFFEAPASRERIMRRIAVGKVTEQAVTSALGISHHDLFRTSRGVAPIALARQVAMYLAHVTGELPLTEIGKIFGRDRTTVAHACCLIEDRRDDPAFDRTMEILESTIKSRLGAHTHLPPVTPVPLSIDADQVEAP